MKVFLFAFLALGGAALSPPARAVDIETPPTPLPLAWCVERAAAANPAVAESAARADAARARVGAAGAFDDPRISYEASNIPTGDFDFGSTPLSGHQLGLRQKLPFPGLLGAQRASAAAARDAAGLDLADRRRQVRSAVESAWASLGFDQRALEITDRNLALLRQLTRIAEARYAVGSGLQQDALRAQVELTALLQERLARVSSVERSSAGLAALLDLPSGTVFPRTASLEQDAPVPALGTLEARTLATNVGLQALRARIESAAFDARAAELEGYPDVDLGVGYRVREKVEGDPVGGDDFVSAGLTIRLPVDRGRWNARAAEERARHRHAKAALRRHEAELAASLRTTHAELVRADQEGKLLRTGLIPQAHQSLEASRSAYEVGRIEFLSLLDSQVRLQEAQLREARAAADRRSAFARLESIVGEALR